MGSTTSILRLRRLWPMAVVASLALVLAACAPEEDPDDPDEPVDEETVGEVQLGYVDWAENVANTYLWAEILEEEGYDVETTQADAGVIFADVADDGVDAFLDVWLPTTHEGYWDEFADEVVDLGIWYEGEATLELAVPQYVADDLGVTSIPDLSGQGEEFGGQIIGIDTGAGLFQITEEDVIPGYGLEDEGWEQVAGSEGAMLAELDTAIEAEEPIVVTLWTPHHAYSAWELVKLEDPEGFYGEGEDLHGVASQAFADEQPEVVEWLENFSVTEDELADLLLRFDEAGDTEDAWREAARDWIEDNRDTVDEWLT